MDAQRTLVHDNIISGYNILAPLPQSNCTDLTCVLSLKYLRELLLKYSGGLDNCDCLADWMVSLQNAELDDEYYGFMHMCPVCQQCIRSRANKERRDIWLTLPETMGVDVDYHITTGAQDTESNILCFTHANPRQRRGQIAYTSYVRNMFARIQFMFRNIILVCPAIHPPMARDAHWASDPLSLDLGDIRQRRTAAISIWLTMFPQAPLPSGQRYGW